MGVTWSVQQGAAGREYIASNGARVYAYLRRPFRPQEWGVHLPQWSAGYGGFRSLKEAKAFAEQYSQAPEVTV